MLYPQKTYVFAGNGFHLEKALPYRDLLNGRWYLQIQSIVFTNLPVNLSAVAIISTPFIKVINEIYGNFETADLDLHILNLKSDALRDCFINFTPMKYLITDPLPIFSLNINTSALSDASKSQCRVTVCCNFFKEI